MYEIEVLYRGRFKYSIKSLNYEVKVDFPKDDASLVDGITPPALLLASLGSCLAVYLERYLNSSKISFDRFTIKVNSDICKDPPKYLKDINIKIDIQASQLDKSRKESLLEFIKNCPVHNTLIHNPAVNIIL